MPEKQPTIHDVFLARKRIAPYLRPTPLLRPGGLGRALGCEAFVKCENTQPVGAFKVRGGINLAVAEGASLKGCGLTAASTGNHGQSVAYAAATFGLPATIFAPEGANPLKVAAMQALGAEVRLVGRDFDAAREACEAFAVETGARYVHSMNEPLLVAGVATAYLEALEEVPDAEVILVPIGGGSGASGASIVAKSLNPGIKVVGVQAEGAPAVYRSFHSRRLESTEQIQTIAEGLATRVAFDLPLSILWRFLDDVVLVSDAELQAAMRLLLETTHQVAEAAGAAATAAAQRYPGLVRGKKVILPISGGNATLEQLRDAIEAGRHPRD
ncbi:MAG: pyridoxal-phosphate dependent enzyme [Firmicutes bacterium]|nr:pyridoxal-phosphate dependent enzyme [Bacillota bacterium]MCL5038621.1 pyridoxal-phosphate dependent enzyme [Bacillota bacterium]